MDAASSSLKSVPLMEALWPSARGGAARFVVLAVAGVLVMALSAEARVPFWPIPMTLQTLAVFLLAAVYGARLGIATVALYLIVGAVGLPVFAGTPERGLGLAYMTGPTGGYLLGFLLAAGLVGWLADCGWPRRLFGAGLAMSLGLAAVALPGWAWLAVLIGPVEALSAGIAPFMPGEVVKVFLAMTLLPLLWTLAEGRRVSAGISQAS